MRNFTVEILASIITEGESTPERTYDSVRNFLTYMLGDSSFRHHAQLNGIRVDGFVISSVDNTTPDKRR